MGLPLAPGQDQEADQEDREAILVAASVGLVALAVVQPFPEATHPYLERELVQEEAVLVFLLIAR